MPQGLDPFAWIVIGFIAGVVGGWFWTNVLHQDRAGGFLGAVLIAILGSAFLLALIRGFSRH